MSLPIFDSITKFVDKGYGIRRMCGRMTSQLLVPVVLQLAQLCYTFNVQAFISTESLFWSQLYMEAAHSWVFVAIAHL